MAAEETSEMSSIESIEDHSDLWLTKPFKENQFWFMKPDDTLEATEIAPDGPEGALTTLGSTFSGDEQAVININNLVIKVRIPCVFQSFMGQNTKAPQYHHRVFLPIKDWNTLY